MKMGTSSGNVRVSTAHNGLVAGSSPAGPTKKSITYHVFILQPVGHRTRNASVVLNYLCTIRSGESPSSLIVDSAALSRQEAKRRFRSSFIERPINGRRSLSARQTPLSVCSAGVRLLPYWRGLVAPAALMQLAVSSSVDW